MDDSDSSDADRNNINYTQILNIKYIRHSHRFNLSNAAGCAFLRPFTAAHNSVSDINFIFKERSDIS